MSNIPIHLLSELFLVSSYYFIYFSPAICLPLKKGHTKQQAPDIHNEPNKQYVREDNPCILFSCTKGYALGCTKDTLCPWLY